MRDATAKLTRKVEDLEDVRSVMGILKEVAPAWSCCKLAYALLQYLWDHTAKLAQEQTQCS